jgi:hypothetical protein
MLCRRRRTSDGTPWEGHGMPVRSCSGDRGDRRAAMGSDIWVGRTSVPNSGRGYWCLLTRVYSRVGYFVHGSSIWVPEKKTNKRVVRRLLARRGCLVSGWVRWPKPLRAVPTRMPWWGKCASRGIQWEAGGKRCERLWVNPA